MLHVGGQADDGDPRRLRDCRTLEALADRIGTPGQKVFANVSLTTATRLPLLPSCSSKNRPPFNLMPIALKYPGEAGRWRTTGLDFARLERRAALGVEERPPVTAERRTADDADGFDARQRRDSARQAIPERVDFLARSAPSSSPP